MNRLIKLMCAVAAMSTLSVFAENSMSEWESLMMINRPHLPPKETRSQLSLEDNALKRNSLSFSEVATIATRTLGRAIPESALWRTLFRSNEERIDVGDFSFDDGTTNTFAVYEQLGNLTPYYWTVNGLSSGLDVPSEDFMKSRCIVNDSSSVRWVDRVLSAEEVDIFEMGTTNAVVLPYQRFWFFFVNDMPGANWAHPCRYIAVSEDCSSFTVLYKMMPPRLFEKVSQDRIQLRTFREKNDEQLKTLEKVKENVYEYARNLKANSLSYQVGNASKSYFVLISGGADPENNGIRFWCDTAMLYSTLTLKYGVGKDNIYVYMSDGTSSANDANLGDENNPVLVSSPVDLDGDGFTDIDGAATKSNISSCFSSLMSKLTADDQLFVFVTSHGGPDGTAGINNYDCKAYLYSSSGSAPFFRDDELASWTSGFSCPVAFAMEPCYSGGFVDDITQTANRVIATACNHYESSLGYGAGGAWDKDITGSTGAVNCWAVELTTALRGYQPRSIAYYAYPWEDGGAKNADANGDGLVSFGEARIYAYENDSARCTLSTHTSTCGKDNNVEHPQYAESTDGLGDKFFMLKQASSVDPRWSFSLTDSTVGADGGCILKKTFGADGGVATVTITCSSSYLTESFFLPTRSVMNGYPDWFEDSVSAKANVCSWSLSLDPNNSTSPRSVIVTFAYRDLSQKVMIVQEGKSSTTTYTVTYKRGANGTGSQQTATKTQNVALTLKDAIFTRIGYTQTGWSTTDGGSKAYNLGASYTDNAAITLYPYWTANTYSIAYVLNSGTAGASKPTSATYDTAFKVSAPSRSGYTFAGWTVTNGLNISTAKYGTTSSSQTTSITSSSQKCLNGATGDVWFKNLRSTSGSVTLTANWVPVSSRPENDNFANATRISGATGSTSGSNVGATYETGEPLKNYKPAATNTIWWVWTAPSSGTATFSTTNTTFDTVMGVYTGTSVSSLTTIKQDDDGGPNNTSICTFDAVSGTTYYIAVSGYGAANQGTIKLYWSIVSLQTYAVTYNPGSYISGLVYTATKTNNVTLVLRNATYSRTGYTQTAWSTRSDGTSRNYELGANYTANAPLTLYPYWTTNTYTVSYSLDGGTHGTTHPTSAAYDTVFYVSAPNKSGHTFAGWTVTNGLDISTAKWGKTSSPSTSLTSSSTKCVNGATGNVYFKNLRPTTGNVALKANWTCNHVSTVVQNARAATCTVAGYTGDTVCSTCGVTISTGSTIQALGHQEGAGVVTKEPTTTEEGVMTYSCTRCGFIMRTEAIPKVVATYPDLGFATFTNWNFGYSMFTTTNSESDVFSCAPVRLFNCGEPLRVVHGYANFGDAAILNVTVKTLREMVSDVGNRVAKTTQGTLSLESYWGARSATDATAWTNLTAGVYTAIVTLDADNVIAETNRANNVREFVFAIRDPLALGAALGCSNLALGTNGDDWYGTRDGSDKTASYARTKHLGNYGTNVLSTTVSGAGTLSFDWKVSSEKNYDWLEFLVDGVITNRISGTNCVWQSCSYELTGGNHVIEWRYRKDESYYDGFDCAWLANVEWTPVTYTVTYKPGSYASGSTYTVTKTNGIALALRNATYSRTGYTQTAWSTSSSGTSRDYELGAAYTANAAITLYPYWAAKSYTVTFNANGGAVSQSSKTVTYGSTYGELPTPTRTVTGYTCTFLGWYTADDGGTQITASSIVSITAAQTLYARWSFAPITYTVTYKPGANGTGSQQTAMKTNDVALVLKDAIFTRTGYTQAGWSTTDGGSKAYNLGEPYTSNAALTLYPYWTCNHASTTVQNARVATCTVAGYTGDTVCSTCGAIVATGSTIPALGHNEGAGVVTKEPTTTEEGVMTYSCTRCGIVMRTEAIPKVAPTEEVAVPTVHVNGGAAIVTTGEFSGGSCEVSLFCATEGATIYYTTNGATPRLTDRYRYTGPFTINENVTIKAIAVLGEEKSEYAIVTITKRLLTLGEAASVDATSASLQWTTGGDAEWTPIIDETSSTGFSAQSGAIGDATGTELSRTWLQTEVTGKGTVSFRWKVDCEWDDSGDATWDRVMFFTNGVEAARMDGTSGWEALTFTFADAGVHTLRWEFVKDDYNDEEFGDLAWVSGFAWTSGGRIATLPADSTAETVNAAVDGYGFADSDVKTMVNGDVRAFNDFAVWSQGVAGGKDAVVASEYAAVSYLLRAEKVFTNEPTIEISEIAGGGQAGAFSLAVSVRDGMDTVAVSSEKVAEMFEATNDLRDWIGGRLVPDVVDMTDARTNIVRFNVGFGEGSASAFIRLKVRAKMSTISPPGGMNASRTTSGVVVVSWNAVEGASGYEVWRANGEPVVANAKLIAVVKDKTSYDDGDVEAGTMYYYWLRTMTGIGYSDFGDYVMGCVESATYAVTYSPGSYGTGSQQTDTKTQNVALTLKGAIFTRTGYTQTGWSTTDGGSKEYNLDATYTSNAVLTLYPYWTANTYNVAYVLNGGTVGLSAPTSATYDTAFKVSAPSRSGYTFAGWTVTSGLNVSTAKHGTTSSSQATGITSSSQMCLNGATGDVWFKDLTPVANGNVTLYAVWLASPSSVSATDATSTSEVTVTWPAVTHATYYQVWRGTTSSSGSATQIGYNVAGTSYSDTTALVGTNYYYWVKAVCGSVVSSFSRSDVGRRMIAAPSGVTVATDSSGTNLVVSWSEAVTGATKYEIWRATYTQTSGGSVTTSSALSRIATVAAVTQRKTGINTYVYVNTTTYTESPNLSGNKFYRYVVKAVGGTDTSAASNYSEIRTYKNAGSYSLSLPATANYSVVAVGGGGGGAQCAQSANLGFYVVGGGSGAYYNGTLRLSAANYTVTVGSGGAAAMANTSYSASATAGGASMLAKGSVACVSAGGGGGGRVTGSSASGGVGGSVTIGSSTTIVSTTSNINGKSGSGGWNLSVSATCGASVYGGYGVGGGSTSSGGTGFFQITINEQK